MQRLVDIAPAQIPQIWSLLSQIPDPEVPVLTITDLGMVRSVKAQGEGWVIGFTPTYSGCPATEHLLGAIRDVMTAHGFTPVHIVLQLDHRLDDRRRARTPAGLRHQPARGA